MANCRMYLVCGICSPKDEWLGPQDLSYALAKWYPGDPYWSVGQDTGKFNEWLGQHAHDREVEKNGPDHFRVEYA